MAALRPMLVAMQHHRSSGADLAHFAAAAPRDLKTAGGAATNLTGAGATSLARASALALSPSVAGEQDQHRQQRTACAQPPHLAISTECRGESAMRHGVLPTRNR